MGLQATLSSSCCDACDSALCEESSWQAGQLHPVIYFVHLCKFRLLLCGTGAVLDMTSGGAVAYAALV